MIFLLRTCRDIGVKLFTAVYHFTRAALFIVKMLNHEEKNCRSIARNSLTLDMKKGVDLTVGTNNFFSSSVNESGFIQTRKLLSLFQITCRRSKPTSSIPKTTKH